MSSISRYPYCEVVAYASLSAEARRSGSDLECLSRFTMKIPGEVDIMAEDVHPSERLRPLWNVILDLIEHRLVRTVIVSSLYDIAGNNVHRLSHFLCLAGVHHVRVWMVKEGLDSFRDTKCEILSIAIRRFRLKNIQKPATTDRIEI